MEIGERISVLLLKNRMSQRQLAEEVGVTEVTISRYVNGKRVPNGHVLANIARTLHTTTDFLLGQETDRHDDYAYIQVKHTIECYRKSWSNRQKAELVNTIFGCE